MALQLSNAGGADLLVKHAKPPCPPVPVAAPAGPSKTKHDRAATIISLIKPGILVVLVVKVPQLELEEGGWRNRWTLGGPGVG